MDFKQLIGKEVLWTGSSVDDDGLRHDYVLLSDETCMHIPNPETGEAPALLATPIETLLNLLDEKVDEALNILELALVLRRLNFESLEESDTADDDIGQVLTPFLKKALGQGLPELEKEEDKHKSHVVRVEVHTDSEASAERIAEEIIHADGDDDERPTDD